MAVFWLLVQLWLLCCVTYVAAGLLGFDPLRTFRRIPVLALLFLLVRVFV